VTDTCHYLTLLLLIIKHVSDKVTGNTTILAHARAHGGEKWGIICHLSLSRPKPLTGRYLAGDRLSVTRLSLKTRQGLPAGGDDRGGDKVLVTSESTCVIIVTGKRGKQGRFGCGVMVWGFLTCNRIAFVRKEAQCCYKLPSTQFYANTASKA
jgi:hypothetical protein